MGDGDALRPRPLPAAAAALLLLAAAAAAPASLELAAPARADAAACAPEGLACVEEARERDGCSWDSARADAPRSGAHVEARSCEGANEGDYVVVEAREPTGRNRVVWEDGRSAEGSYRLLSIDRPPRIVMWYADERGCVVGTYVAHEQDLACGALGAPPPPPRAGYGRLLP